MVEVTLWGVRGSTPAPHREQWRYGGNTPCVSVRVPSVEPDGEPALFILDAGTGITELGDHLLGQFLSPGLRAYFLFSHYHWDHVQGLPFFELLYTAGNSFDFYGPRPQGRDASLQGVLENLMAPPYFPVGPEELRAQRRFREIGEESLTVDGVALTTRRLNHPQGSMGYRFEAGGVTVVYATDHEPGVAAFDRAVRELAANADLLITDAQYLPTELGARFRGWGHSSWAEAVAIARDANVKNLLLFHHEPGRHDEEIDAILREARRHFPATWAATQQTTFSVEPAGLRVASLGRRLSQRLPAQRSIILEGQEDGQRFAEEAWLENLSFHGAYFFSGRPLDLNSRVRVRLEANGASRNALGTAPQHNGHFELTGIVVRTDAVRGQADAEGRQKFGVAVHFPGVPEE